MESKPQTLHPPSFFHPIVIDRLVDFLYTSTYTFHSTSTRRKIQPDAYPLPNATLIPPNYPPSSTASPHPMLPMHMLHMHMFALATALEYPALKTVAHRNLVNGLYHRDKCSTAELKEVISMLFGAAAKTSDRLCDDDASALQDVLVVAVLAHNNTHWSDDERRAFVFIMDGPEFADFWSSYERVKKENGDLISQDEGERGLAEQFKAGRAFTKSSNGPKHFGSGAGAGFGAGVVKTRREIKGLDFGDGERDEMEEEEEEDREDEIKMYVDDWCDA